MMRPLDETTILRFCHLLEENNLSIQLLAAQRHIGYQRPDAQDRHGGGRNAYCRAQLHQEQQR